MDVYTCKHVEGQAFSYSFLCNGSVCVYLDIQRAISRGRQVCCCCCCWWVAVINVDRWAHPPL